MQQTILEVSKEALQVIDQAWFSVSWLLLFSGVSFLFLGKRK